MTGAVQEGKDEKEWDAAETEAFCLSSDMPLAVVHPCKSPEVIHKVCSALHSITIQADAPSWISALLACPCAFLHQPRGHSEGA